MYIGTVILLKVLPSDSLRQKEANYKLRFCIFQLGALGEELTTPQLKKKKSLL